MKKQQTGMTLIEILIIVLVVSVGMAATAKFQGDLLQSGATTKARTQALSFIQNEIEVLRMNHGIAAAGSQDDVAGSNALYDLSWDVTALAGLADTDQYTATVAWKDNQNRAQSVQLGTVLYADRMLGGGAADSQVRAEAAQCVFDDYCFGEAGPGIELTNEPTAEEVTETLDDGTGRPPEESWTGVEDPQTGADEYSQNQTVNLGDSSDKVYLDKGSNKDINLGGGDNILTLDGNSKNIIAGGGDDQVEVDGNVNGYIDLGNGNNKVLVDGNLNGDIYVGSGNDEIILEGNANGILISLGDGNNFLELDGNLNANVSSGSGNDVVVIDGNANSGFISLGDGSNWLDIEGNSSVTITGGSGTDIIGVEGNLNGQPLSLFAGNDYLFVEGIIHGGVSMGTGDDFVCVAGDVNGSIDGGDGNDSIYLSKFNRADWTWQNDNLVSFENIRFKNGEVIGDASVFNAIDPDSDCALDDKFNPGSSGNTITYYLYRIDYLIDASSLQRFQTLDKEGDLWVLYLEDRDISDEGYDAVNSDDKSLLDVIYEDYKGSLALETAFRAFACSETHSSCTQGSGSFSLKSSEEIPDIGDSKTFALATRWYQQTDLSWVLELRLTTVNK